MLSFADSRSVPGWTVWTHRCPGGETAAQVQARVDAILAEVRGAVGRGDVVLVGHGRFSRVLVARWIGLPAVKGVHFALGASAWTVLGDERGVPRVDHANVGPTS